MLFTAAHNKIRVLIVDDSASVRTTLSEIISADPDLEVMATAADTVIAEAGLAVETGEIPPEDVVTPGILVDFAVQGGV